MSSLPLLKPELFDSAKPPRLKGGKCACGYVFFPMQRFGCELCGATGDALQPTDLSSAGTLIASALVHVHKGEGREAPFVVASVQLNDGPAVRTLLDCDPRAPALKPGASVSGCLVETKNRNGESCQDFRFKAAEY